ncbi:MAG: hypothetical protein L0226_16145 [Acidobacteria bacterium]|nr:hypothetical protein [Acidobacteriota bacterium]
MALDKIGKIGLRLYSAGSFPYTSKVIEHRQPSVTKTTISTATRAAGAVLSLAAAFAFKVGGMGRVCRLGPIEERLFGLSATAPQDVIRNAYREESYDSNKREQSELAELAELGK